MMTEMENLQQGQDTIKKGPSAFKLILEVVLLSIFAVYISSCLVGFFGFSDSGFGLIGIMGISWISLNFFPPTFLFILALTSIVLFVKCFSFSITAIKKSLAQKRNLSVKEMLSIALIIFLFVISFVSTWWSLATLGFSSGVF